MHGLPLSVAVASFLLALPLLIVTGQNGFATVEPQEGAARVIASPPAPVVLPRTPSSAAAPAQ